MHYLFTRNCIILTCVGSPMGRLRKVTSSWRGDRKSGSWPAARVEASGGLSVHLGCPRLTSVSPVTRVLTREPSGHTKEIDIYARLASYHNNISLLYKHSKIIDLLYWAFKEENGEVQEAVFLNRNVITMARE